MNIPGTFTQKLRLKIAYLSITVCVSFLSLPQLAHADYAAIATGKSYLTILDLSTNQLAGNVEIGAPTRAVTFGKLGQTAYVAAGTKLFSVQISTRKVLASLTFQQPIQSVQSNASGTKIILLTKGSTSNIFLVTDNPLKVIKRIPLRKQKATLFAVNPSATRAAFTSGKRSQLSVVNLTDQQSTPTIQPITLPATGQKKQQRPSSRKKPLLNVRGIRFENNQTLWASTAGKQTALTAINSSNKKVGPSIPTPLKTSGTVVINQKQHIALIGSSSNQTQPVVVNLKTRSVLKLPAGTEGSSANSFSPDNYYYYLLNAKQKLITLISRVKNIQTEIVRLPEDWQPADIAIQPEVANQTGTAGDDILLGSRYPNTINGLDGNDTLNGFLGADTINGGNGNDKIYGGADPDTLIGADGNDELYEADGSGKIFGGAGDDTIDGGTGGDTINGEAGDDTIDGGEHDDTIYGGEGNDRIVEKGLGNEPLIDGGPGNDYIDGGLGNDYRILGGDGNDTLLGNSGLEAIEGGNGDDKIDGGEGDDRLEGQDGQDTIRGSQNNDTISGGLNDDTIDGGSADDLLAGDDDGNDTIIGGTGMDTIDAGAGDDTIRVADQDTPVDAKLRRFTSDLDKPLPIESSADTVNCGPGNDTVYTENTANSQDKFTNCEKIIKISPEPSNEDPLPETTIIGVEGQDTITGTPERDILLGADGNDIVNGGEGNDYVDGENDDDKVYGGPGDDTAQGRYGKDLIDGGDGNDYIMGGYGNDTLFGGPGDDFLNSGNDPDTIDAGPGNDQIMVANGRKDTVNCGTGQDLVFADLIDTITPGSCEMIRYQ